MKVVIAEKQKPFEYQGQIRRPGDVVDVPSPLGRAWQMMRRADIKAEEAAPAVAEDEPRTKRQYRRRDMQVED